MTECTCTYQAPFTGSVVRTTNSKFSERISVLDFGAVGDGMTDDTAAFAAAFAAYDHIYAPAGEYLIDGAGFTMSSGQSLHGEVAKAVDNVAVSGTRLKMNNTATRAITISSGNGVIIDGIAFNGKITGDPGRGTAHAIYADTIDHCQLTNLLFSKFQTCIEFHGKCWMNLLGDIRAFVFDKFFLGTGESEDSEMRRVIARGYNSGSIAVDLQVYSQTFAFYGCDLGHSGTSVNVNLTANPCTLLFDSCYFEIEANDSLGLQRVFNLATTSGLEIAVQLNNCRIYNEGGANLPTATAFYGSGAGSSDITVNGCTFDSFTTLFKDGSSGFITRVGGTSNVINHNPATTIVFDGVLNAARRLEFVGPTNIKNLESIGPIYVVEHDFNVGDLILNLANSATTGIYRIDLTPVGHPANLARYLFQPKGYFTHGIATEILDTTSSFSAAVSGNQITISCSIAPLGAPTMQMIVEKIA